MSYKVIPIPSEIAESVRENLKSPQYGHPASISLATGYGPCRSCLRTFNQGKEERILFTYNSFERLSNLPLPSPVFIHRNNCEEYRGNDLPKEIVDLPIIFEAFGNNSEMLKREPIDRDKIDQQIEEMLSLPNVNFINIRNAEAGCFIARIETQMNIS